MKKTRYSVTLPNGNAASRTSARVYTHVWAARNDDSDWGVYGFAGSRELAEKARDAWIARTRRFNDERDWEYKILPVEVD